MDRKNLPPVGVLRGCGELDLGRRAENEWCFGPAPRQKNRSNAIVLIGTSPRDIKPRKASLGLAKQLEKARFRPSVVAVSSFDLHFPALDGLPFLPKGWPPPGDKLLRRRLQSALSIRWRVQPGPTVRAAFGIQLSHRCGRPARSAALARSRAQLPALIRRAATISASDGQRRRWRARFG